MAIAFLLQFQNRGAAHRIEQRLAHGHATGVASFDAAKEHGIRHQPPPIARGRLTGEQRTQAQVLFGQRIPNVLKGK